ncbi:MAG: hypothetical protein ABFD92_15735 [Planctomycetaceae bacterium]|nr:DUF11 domain-containing protein [Planctomycetaceae bacterium]
MNRFAFACACAALGAMSILSGCDACFPGSSFESSPTPLVTTRVTGLPEAKASPTTRPANGACDLSVSRFLPPGDRTCAVLEVRKTAPANIESASTFTYRIEVTNLTQSPLQGVIVKETLPGPFEVAGATAGATRTGSTIQWDVGTLDASASRSFAIRGTSSSGGNIMGCTRVDYDVAPVCLDMQVAQAELLPPVPSQATASPQALPAESHSPSRSEPSPSASNASRWAQDDSRLAINISAPPRQRAGQNLVYVVHVANSGRTTVSGVTVTSLLPPGAMFMEASDGGRQMNGQITWSLNSLAPGQTREFTVILKADRPGTLHTTAVATGRNASVSGEAVTLIEQGSSATAAPGPQPQDSDR